MSDIVRYLFACDTAPLPCMQIHPDAPPPASLTVMLAENGLFARVATPTVRATLPLAESCSHPIRGLAPCATALDRAYTAAPHPATLPPLIYAVARPSGRALPVHVGCGHAAEPNGPLTYIVAGTGVYASYATPVYEARVRVATLPPGLDLGLAPLDEGVTLRVPRIPSALLHAMAVDAVRITRDSGREAVWQVRWDEEAGWTTARPVQDGSGAHVTYTPSSDPNVLLTVHSHGRHHTYWSRTDDDDEMGCGFNAVIGDLGDGLRAARLLMRVSVFGHRLDVPASSVFEGLLPVEDGLMAAETHRPCHAGRFSRTRTGLDTPDTSVVGRWPDGVEGLPATIGEPMRRTERRMRRGLTGWMASLRRSRR